MSRLSRDNWASVALDALGEGGLAAVAVEPLAARLGATKGSFYWHFRNRDELIEAALGQWQQVSTAAVIERLEAGGATARDRLRHLFTMVFARQAHTDADLALLASADHPLVARALAQATRQRLDYVTGLFEQLGFTADLARQRALLAYSAYVGQLQLLRSAPDLVPSPGPARTAYGDEVLAMLTAPDAPGRAASGTSERRPAAP